MGIGNRIGRNKKEVDKAEYDKYQKWEKEQKSFQEKSLKSNDEYIKKYSIGIDSLPNIFGKLADAASSFLSEGALDGTIQLLEGQAQDVANSFGVARGRIEEFKQVIADASPELVKMGIDQTKVAENYGAIAKEMGGAASLGTEAIVEMSAAAKVSGQDVGKLAQEFRNVGVSMYDVGDQMKEVANYARSVGVSVSAVSTGVVGNLGKLNTFNFDGGVNGLAKMAAQAVNMRINIRYNIKCMYRICFII
jgi:methyl-accepting chemotaxis protein